MQQSGFTSKGFLRNAESDCRQGTVPKSRFVPLVSVFDLRKSVARKGSRKAATDSHRISRMRAKKYFIAVHDWLDAQDTRWVAPGCVVGELKKLKTENGSDADMILFFSYPCLIRALPWLEKDLENQPRICTDLHGCEPRSISALFMVVAYCQAS